MALKVSTGFTRKLGQPDYGSIGASCNVEFELDLSYFEPGDAFLGPTNTAAGGRLKVKYVF